MLSLILALAFGELICFYVSPRAVPDAIDSFNILARRLVVRHRKENPVHAPALALEKLSDLLAYVGALWRDGAAFRVVLK